MYTNLVRLITQSVSNISQKKYVYEFESSVAQHYHLQRQSTSGTDRYYLSPNLIALVDGSAGNFDASLVDYNEYPSRLIELISKFHTNEQSEFFKKPEDFIKQSLHFNKNLGSATVTLLMLNAESGKLKCFYIGNSVYALFRQKQVEIVAAQEKSLNNSFTIGLMGVDPALGFTEEYHQPYINEDDIIVIATNGLWDNLALDYIHYEVKGPLSYRFHPKTNKDQSHSKESKTLLEMANSVKQLAKIASLKGNYESPIYLKAKAQGIKAPKEGLMDDITIIVARIVKNEQIY